MVEEALQRAREQGIERDLAADGQRQVTEDQQRLDAVYFFPDHGTPTSVALWNSG